MKFNLNVTTGHKALSLDDYSDTVTGIEYYENVCQLAGHTIHPSKVTVERTCLIHNSISINLNNAFHVIDNDVETGSLMELILNNKKLRGVDYFKFKDTVDVIIRPGLLSKYMKMVIIQMRHNRIIPKKWYDLFGSDTSISELDGLVVRYVFCEWSFVRDWMRADCPLYFGITSEELQILIDAWNSTH